MSKTVAPYTQEQITEGLLAVIAAAGNAAEGERQTGVPAATLRGWRNEQYADLYRRLEEQYGRQIEEEIVARARENANAAAQAVQEGIAATVDEIRSGKCRDVAKATELLAKTMSVSVDRVLSLTGRPVNPEGTSAKDILALISTMQAAGVLRVVDSTAEEVT